MRRDLYTLVDTRTGRRYDPQINQASRKKMTPQDAADLNRDCQMMGLPYRWKRTQIVREVGHWCAVTE